MSATPDLLPLPLAAAPRLEVLEADNHRIVVLNGYAAAQYSRDDLGTERVILAQLSEALPLPDREIARVFGMHPVTLSRLRALSRSGGAQALMPVRRGPKGPMKLTPQMESRILRLRQEEGLSYREIAKRLSSGRRTISYGSVANVVRQQASKAQALSLPLEEEDESQSLPEPTARGPVLEPGESRTSRYAGAMLLYAGLGKLDLWGVFGQLAATVGPSRRFGWLQTVATIVLCFALRFRSIEDMKNAHRDDLGVIIGEPWAPGVQTLREKLAGLSESVDPETVMRELFKRYLALEPVWEGMYYVDGHFCPYYGAHPTPSGWNAKRRLAMHGHTDVYIHDARGRVLYFLSQPLNSSLSRAVPSLVEEIRQVHGAGPFTLVFDRGGYSGKLFRWLSDQGIGFITYLKGRKARRRQPANRFGRGWFFFEKRRHVYQVYEKKTRIQGAGMLRTVIWLDESEQIPVLTNLDPSVRPAKIIHCLRLRWRQENNLKYLLDHFGIDQIIQYGATDEEEDREVENPKRKKLRERVHKVSQEIESLEAELGRILDRNAESRHRTQRGIKIAHSKLRQRIAARRQTRSRLESRLRHTPAKVRSSELPEGGKRALLSEDRRLIAQAIKLAAYNAERLLALQFNQHYQQAKDVFSVFRSLLHLSGTVSRPAEDRIEVFLERPRPEKVARAFEQLLTQINAEGSRFLGDGPLIRFQLESKG